MWNHPNWLETKNLVGCVHFAALLLAVLVVACGTSYQELVVGTVQPSPLVIELDQPAVTAEWVSPTLPSVESTTRMGSLPSIADLVENSSPWVVSITTESFVRGFFADYKNQESGSGIIVRSDGYIVTNYHVIQNSMDVKAHLPSGETYRALVIGVDQVTDLAVLKIDAKDLPSPKFAISDELRVGDWVVTIGNALALKGGPTVTLGIVSGLDRTISTDEGHQFYDLIQTDAAINTGNSGGPLVNMLGEVVGINQARLPRAQGMGFAIDAEVAVPIIETLIEFGKVTRPMIGFLGEDVTVANSDALNLGVDEGVIVTVIARGGPAYRAGIRIGDVLTKIDGISVSDVETWLKLLWSYDVGSKVKVELFRNREAFDTIVQLGERES